MTWKYGNMSLWQLGRHTPAVWVLPRNPKKQRLAGQQLCHRGWGTLPELVGDVESFLESKSELCGSLSQSGLILNPSQDRCLEAPLQESHMRKEVAGQRKYITLVRGREVKYFWKKLFEEEALKKLLVRKGPSLNTRGKKGPHARNLPQRESVKIRTTFCPSSPLFPPTFFSSGSLRNLVTSWGRGDSEGLVLWGRGKVRLHYWTVSQQQNPPQKWFHIKPG